MTQDIHFSIPGPGRTLAVINHQTRTTLHVEPVRTVLGLLKLLGMVPETVLVIEDDRLLCDDDPIDPSRPVEIRPVISGGERL